MNSEAELIIDAISDWKSNDGWEFADREAAWKFFFQAGAASRDAEIQRLQFALSDTEALECGTAEKCDKLRAQINSLREALEKILSQESDNGSILSAGNCAEIAYEALASIPEQSLAEYRNKVIEECACIFGGPNTPVSNEEAEAWRNPPAAIRALKEQP